MTPSEGNQAYAGGEFGMKHGVINYLENRIARENMTIFYETVQSD